MSPLEKPIMLKDSVSSVAAASFGAEEVQTVAMLAYSEQRQAALEDYISGLKILLGQSEAQVRNPPVAVVDSIVDVVPMTEGGTESSGRQRLGVSVLTRHGSFEYGHDTLPTLQWKEQDANITR